MYPLLTTLEWRGVVRPIGSYGVLLALALLVGAWVGLRSSQRAGLESGAMIAALAGAVGSGFAGAFGLSIAVAWLRSGSLQAALANPGIVFYGGLISGTLGLAACARGFGLPPLPTLDSMLPAVPLAHAIGRIGCLLGGCCYGAHTELPWAVHLAADPSGLARHPWPLYEAACLVLLSALFWSPRRFSGVPGQRAASYVLLYALVRFALEPLRADAVRGMHFDGVWSTSQLISLALLCLVGGALIVQQPRAKLSNR